jgi:hypothetical protein
MTEASKSHPAPLDAYETAKPDEPIFTLQGGDPLAAPLVRIWAYLARVRAGMRGDASMIAAPLHVAQVTSVEHDEEKRNELLVRASQAEEVSWHMDGYRRGEITHEAEIASVSDLAKLDIYDIRRRMASAVSNYRCSIVEFREELKSRGFIQDHDKIDDAVNASNICLIALHEFVEIRRAK